MKIKQLLTSFLACMALWSVPVADAVNDLENKVQQAFNDAGNKVQSRIQLALSKGPSLDETLAKIKTMKDKIEKAKIQNKTREKITKATDAKNYIYMQLSKDKFFFPDSLGLKDYIEKIKNIKFGLIKKRVNKKITLMEKTLQKIEDQVKEKMK